MNSRRFLSIGLVLLVPALVLVSLGAPSTTRASSYDDEFSGTTLDPKWSWVKQDATHWSLTAKPGSMRITTQAGDLPSSGGANNILLQTLPGGDFEVSTKLDFAPTNDYQQAGLVLYQSDTELFKLVRLHAGTQVLDFAHANGSFGELFAAFDGSSVYLKIQKTGSTYAGYYSADGTTWNLITSYESTVAPPQAGLVAFNGPLDAPEINADFDYFHLTLPDATPTATSTVVATDTPTATPSSTATTVTATGTPTDTATAVPTSTATTTSISVPTATSTATTEPTPTSTSIPATVTATATATSAPPTPTNTPVAGDFSVTASTPIQSVNAGGSANYSIIITTTGGFKEPIRLAVSGLPSGTSSFFSANPATTASVLSVSTSASTTAGSYSLTITATSSALSRSTNAFLVVSAGSAGNSASVNWVTDYVASQFDNFRQTVVAVMQERLATIEGIVNTLKSRVSSLEQNVTLLQRQVNSAVADVFNLKQHVSALETASRGTIPAGSNSKSVSDTRVGSASHISVTLTSDPGDGDVAVSWIEPKPGQGFTVHLTQKAKKDTTFTYVVVGQ